MRSRKPFCRGSIPPGHCQFEAAAEAAPMAGWRAHAILERFPGDSAEGSGRFLLAFQRGFVGVPPGAHRDFVGILRRFCGGFCWNQQGVWGLPRAPRKPPMPRPSAAEGSQQPRPVQRAFWRSCAQHASPAGRRTIHARTTVWPSGLRRWLQAPVRKGVGSNPTAVTRVMQHRLFSLAGRAPAQ